MPVIMTITLKSAQYATYGNHTVGLSELLSEFAVMLSWLFYKLEG